MKTLPNLFIILLLSGCCDSYNREDCSARELAEIEKKEKKANIPEFVASQDGVKLYRVWTIEPDARNHWTYFTTPCGSTSSQIEWLESSGKVTNTYNIPSGTKGNDCK